MARKSIQELISQANATLADNNVGAITPAEVRGMFLDLLNAIKPAYAGMGVVGAAVTLNIAPALVVMNQQLNSSPSEFTITLPASTLARLERGTTYLNVDVDVEAPANRFIRVQLFKDGVATGADVTVNGAGAGNPVSGSFSWIDYADPAATYTLVASAEIDGVAATLSASVLAQIQPVNSYV